MQFVVDGPDIPNKLIDAHEDGNVIFFCGAGISYPAGLVDFKGLVDLIYSDLGTVKNTIEKAAYDQGQYDATLALLEKRLPGQRLEMRSALKRSLKPKLRRKGAIETHSAILDLARGRDNSIRLVTTNFDLIFDTAIKRKKLKLNSHIAPMLPVPKNSRWNGLVYLHGRLPRSIDNDALQQLVVTSGDFGLAYLTERWAARFVSEMFKNYTVCFIGYTINDGVLRYMMDALAADRMLGETSPTAYAFGECKVGDEANKKREWEAKGVTPILYSDSNKHAALHETLKEWAKTHRDGVFGKEQIVLNHALARPENSTVEDDFVGRVIWALSDPSGLPARTFAELTPVPSLAWLKVFTERRFSRVDLSRFGIESRNRGDKDISFSLINRPAPHSHSSWMSMVSDGIDRARFDEVIGELSHWVLKHLNSFDLFNWVVGQGAHLNYFFKAKVLDKLEQIQRMESAGDKAGLEKLIQASPYSVPNAYMRTLWLLLLTDQIKTRKNEFSFYSWLDKLKVYGLTPSLRIELKNVLAPKIKYSYSLRTGRDLTTSGLDVEISDLSFCTLSLSADHVDQVGKVASEEWRAALPHLFLDLQNLLLDGLNLLSEVGVADEYSDRSYWHLPSISHHWQNKHHEPWVVLIEFLRDSWLTNLELEPSHASRMAISWFSLQFPTFKRLAFFAASVDSSILGAIWVGWLVDDNSHWLWSIETRREVLRLIVLKGNILPKSLRSKLQRSILIGPPREMFAFVEDEEWADFRSRAIWLRIAKLESGGTELSVASKKYLKKMSKIHPSSQVAKDESDEFSAWFSGTGDPGYEERIEVVLAPRVRGELKLWLKQPVKDRFFNKDNWRDLCNERFYHCSFALRDLALEGHWPSVRWNEALYAWSDSKNLGKSFKLLADVILMMPESDFTTSRHAIAWWIEHASQNSNNSDQTKIIAICMRIFLESPEESEDTDEPVTRAINHPIGHAVKALFNNWLAPPPNDNDKLRGAFEPIFKDLSNTNVKKYIHARVLMSSRIITFFRVDPAWTTLNLLPLFNWRTNPEEARCAWQGFLWSPRIFTPLLLKLKDSLFDTPEHYEHLGKSKEQFASFLTYIALDPVDGYEIAQLRASIASLPQPGLDKVARALYQALKSSGEKHVEYWDNRIEPFLKRIWPKSKECKSESISESLILLALVSGERFAKVVPVILPWITPVNNPHYIVKILDESNLASTQSVLVLKVLDKMIGDPMWLPKELDNCLNDIVGGFPEANKDSRFQRLVKLNRQKRH